jgi:MYXO-CTERM domain-containing protein
MSAEAIQPVRVTLPGAAPTVPIRLLAAGTGELTQVTIWIVSDGKYLPANAPTITIESSELVWDFAKDSSDYEAVRAEKLAASGGLAYLVQQAWLYGTLAFQSPLQDLVASDPAKSGYGKDAASAQAALDADMDAMFGKLGDKAWVTRLSADLSREALKSDLLVGAAADQSLFAGSITPENHINAGECPPDPCATGGSSAGGSNSGGSSSGGSSAGGNGAGGSGAGGNGAGGSASGGDSPGGAAGGNDGKDGGCGVSGSPAGNGAALGMVVALGLALRRRRTAR